MRGARIEQPVSIARGFTPSAVLPLSSPPPARILLLLLLLLLMLFVGLRRAADHSYQHNYKLGSRLSVSLTSLHPSRRNTRSLSRPGETSVLLHLLLLLAVSSVSFSLSASFASFHRTVNSFYLTVAADANGPSKNSAECSLNVHGAIGNSQRAIWVFNLPDVRRSRE